MPMHRYLSGIFVFGLIGPGTVLWGQGAVLQPVSIRLPSVELPTTFVVDIEHNGAVRTLELWRHSQRRQDFHLLVQGADGQLREIPAPPARTYRGRVAGEPGTLVAASLLPTGLHATILPKDAPAWTIKPAQLVAPVGERSLHVVAVEKTAAEFGEEGEEIDVELPPSIDDQPLAEALGGEGGGGGLAPCTLKVADLAYDSDYEFYSRAGESDPDTCMAIIEEGLNHTNLIYTRDVKITHRLSTVVLRTDPATDFYGQFPDASNFGAMLSAFRSEWNSNMTTVVRDMAYLLTGKSNPNYGGLAFVGVVCSSSHYGMGIGSPGYGAILRHELGHNWGAGHSCQTARRYIMCGNSIDAISSYNIGVMSSHRDSRSCLDDMDYTADPEPPYARPVITSMVEGDGPLVVDVLRGVTDRNCDAITLTDFDATSALGAAISATEADAGRPGLLYVPRSRFTGTDTFTWTVADGTGFESRDFVIVHIAPRSMVLYLKLDEVSGTDAIDASGFGNDGELEDPLTFAASSVAGQFGRALQLAGDADQFASVGDSSSFQFSRGVTVAAWFKVDAFAGDGETLVAKGDDAWRLKRDGTNRTLKFTCTGVAGTEVKGRTPVDDGQWHHAVGVYDGLRLALYLDGKLESSLPAAGSIDRNSSSIVVGGNAWSGAIDEVRVYNHGLAEAEILALHAGERAENPRPAAGASRITPGTPLAWIGAPGVTEHEIYLGTDPAAVAAATTASSEFRGRRTQTTFSTPLLRDATYYWRIDEVTPGGVVKGPSWNFTTAFAFTGFSEPPRDATSYTPGVGKQELGFATTSTPNSGEDPYVGVIETSSTPTSPIFAHRSLDATTTFTSVDLSERGETSVSILLQARDTGYEAEDFVEVYLTAGANRLGVLRAAGPSLVQVSGSGYLAYGASIPADWAQAQLVVKSSSNSTGGSERYDFDNIAFGCHRSFRVLAATRFQESAAGAASYAPGVNGKELGFATTSTAAGGVSPLAGVVRVTASPLAQYFSHRSVNATTTFADVDLTGWTDVQVFVLLRVGDTGYESPDRLEVFVTNGPERVVLISRTPATGLAELASDDYRAYSAGIPAAWTKARLVVTSASNSSADSERYDLALVEFLSTTTEPQCGEPEPPQPRFRRGDANADQKLDLSDGVSILNYLFIGGVELGCLDASDTNDSATLDLTDAVKIFNYLFVGGEPPAPPGPESCGVDPTEDALSCDGYPACAS